MTTHTVRSAARRLAVAMSAASLLFVAAQAPAQTPTLPKSQAEFEKMINLSPDQKTKIGAIDKKYQPQFAAIQARYKPKFDALQKQYVALVQQAQREAQPLLASHQKEVETVLTADQKAKIKQMDAAMRANGGRKP